MLNCGRAESTGRSALLHAVSMVLEYLPWTEARAFHNLVMVKLEQGRVSWSTDFAGMADQFVDKKVRQNLRVRGASLGTGSSYKTSFSNRNSVGKGFSNFNKSNANVNRNKSLYGVICKQWNNGSCSYGDRCKRWHVCWSCAESGKMGEPHKASSHQSSSANNRQSEQRI